MTSYHAPSLQDLIIPSFKPPAHYSASPLLGAQPFVSSGLVGGHMQRRQAGGHASTHARITRGHRRMHACMHACARTCSHCACMHACIRARSFWDPNHPCASSWQGSPGMCVRGGGAASAREARSCRMKTRPPRGVGVQSAEGGEGVKRPCRGSCGQACTCVAVQCGCRATYPRRLHRHTWALSPSADAAAFVPRTVRLFVPQVRDILLYMRGDTGPHRAPWYSRGIRQRIAK